MDAVGLYSDLPTIATETVVQRKMTLDDVNDVYSYASDPELCKHVEWHHDSVDVSKLFVQWNLNCYLSGKPRRITSGLLVLLGVCNGTGTVYWNHR